jgi:hypothetical protein
MPILSVTGCLHTGNTPGELRFGSDLKPFDELVESLVVETAVPDPVVAALLVSVPWLVVFVAQALSSSVRIINKEIDLNRYFFI